MRAMKNAVLVRFRVVSAPCRAFCLLALAFLLCNCSGIERVQAKRRTNSQLKLRLLQTERQIAELRLTNDALRDINALSNEHDAIERELLSRCEAGDQSACLPKFGR